MPGDSFVSAALNAPGSPVKVAAMGLAALSLFVTAAVSDPATPVNVAAMGLSAGVCLVSATASVPAAPVNVAAIAGGGVARVPACMNRSPVTRASRIATCAVVSEK